MTHFTELGALNKRTGLFDFPYEATKQNDYCCYKCKSDVVFHQGTIRAFHFQHKTKSQCLAYDRPSESDIHLYAKHLLKSKLDSKSKIDIVKRCLCCGVKTPVLKLRPKDYTDNTTAVIEHSFKHNGSNKRADVALITDSQTYIFEIYNTHKTDENDRPEPWFEINAHHLINGYGITSEGVFITCERDYTCGICGEAIKRNEELRIQEMEERTKRNIERQQRDALQAQENKRQREEKIQRDALQAQENKRQREEKIQRDALQAQEKQRQYDKKQRQIQWWKDRKHNSLLKISVWFQKHGVILLWRQKMALRVLEQKARIEQQALEQKARIEKQILEQKARIEQQALEQKARQEQQALEQKARQEQQALEQKARIEQQILEQKARQDALKIQEIELVEYMESLSTIETKALEVAKANIGHIFRLEHTTGFHDWKTAKHGSIIRTNA